MVYIGERDRQERIKEAARKLPPKPTRADLEKAAEDAGVGVSPDDVGGQHEAIHKEPEHHIAPSTRSGVVPSGKFTPEGKPIYRKATPEELQPRAKIIAGPTPQERDVGPIGLSPAAQELVRERQPEITRQRIRERREFKQAKKREEEQRIAREASLKVSSIDKPTKQLPITYVDLFREKPKPKPTFREKVTGQFEEKLGEFREAGEYLRQQKARGKEDRVSQLAIGAGYLGLATAEGVARTVLYPKETVQQIPKLFTQVGFKEFEQSFVDEPVRTLGGVIGTAGVFKGVGKALGTIKGTTLEVPTPEGTKTVYRGVSVEVGKRGQPLVGIAEGKPVVGTPKIDLAKADLSKGLIVETPAQTSIIKQSIKGFFPEVEVAKFEKGLSIMRSTEKTPSRYISKEFAKETKTLSPEGVKDVLDFAKKEGADVYGSFAARQQMPKAGSRIPADIDVQLPYEGPRAEMAAKRLVQRLKTRGEQVRISERSPTLVEAKAGKEWHHAIDIHTTGEQVFGESPSIARERVYGLQLGQKSIKLEGVKLMPLSEQGLRKGGSILTAREKGFAPEAHRIKDIPDFFATQEVLAKSKPLGGGRVLGKLEELKGLYPEDIFKATEPPKILVQKGKQPPFPTPKPSPFIPTLAKQIKPSPQIAPSIRTKPSPYISPPIRKPSPSIIKSISKSISPSRPVSKSISPSISPSKGVSKPISPSKMISPSKIISPSVSKALSPSKPSSPIPKSPDVYKSVSPSPARKPSPSPYYYYTKRTTPTTTTAASSLFREDNLFKKKLKKKTKQFGIGQYKPSLYGADVFKETGQVIKKAPKVTAGIGLRLPTTRQVKGLGGF